MLQKLGITSIVILFTSHLLTVVQQCTGTIDHLQCKNNKGIANIWNDEGACKCSVDLPSNDGYSYVHRGSAYEFHGEPKTWNEARKICEKDGSHLAIIDSDFERKVLLDLAELHIVKLGSINGKPRSRRHVWLGIHDQFQEGEWTTVLDAPLGYAPWSESCYDKPQPDNTLVQNCGTLVRNCGYMDDVQCAWNLTFFCEKPNACL